MTTATLLTPELKPSQFATISKMVKELCGINLHEGKMALVKARLNKRLRALGLDCFGEYVRYVQDEAGGVELLKMLDALSTNLTYFFRESRHFEALAGSTVPQMIARHRDDRKLRLWSAGCSSGEEPYSMAITLRETVPDIDTWDVGILATDLSTEMLHRAQQGEYGLEQLRETPKRLATEYFRRRHRGEKAEYQIKERVKRLVHFARLNLVEPWPMRGLFDAIFCRNVMIYFDKATQNRLIERFWNQLAPGGMLFIGHSESLAGVQHRFRYVLPTVYQKSGS
jgi:chemotaxis protein methyltransferase CheR